ncbi:MAG: hypothetical protein ACREID_02465 [Planctomycetota bacterium]
MMVGRRREPWRRSLVLGLAAALVGALAVLLAAIGNRGVLIGGGIACGLGILWCVREWLARRAFDADRAARSDAGRVEADKAARGIGPTLARVLRECETRSGAEHPDDARLVAKKVQRLCGLFPDEPRLAELRRESCRYPCEGYFMTADSFIQRALRQLRAAGEEIDPPVS